MTAGFRPNPGHLPSVVADKRVRVRLVNGQTHEWPAKTSRWTITGDPFDIAEFVVL
ncbi:hypothetical protein M9978_02525 [Sphingomonas sp. MG17]|uniref:Uncharacterized protein n=1 Tax=Sphingomonas tagetis TaxID=2949092 RepID=A0A9X2HGT9_9SPHN|nr:hypothetical protein [Sphingomonas tagetis]MCP3729292.1 hypothetical protein [Sphingomonas tagetis]